jgi:hypothetical protein
MIMKKIDSFTGEHSFLSNFHPCKVEYCGIEYPSSEHAYQCQRTLDAELSERIRQLPTAGQAKRFARHIPPREDWEFIKNGVMMQVLLAKFMQNEDLAAKLLATGDAFLEEGNSWGDKYWGTVNGEGKNMLGIYLMSVRTDLQLEKYPWP